MKKGKKRVNKDDEHVGKMIRKYRHERKMSLTKLGEMIGVSAQQVQKYESGINRVAATRLQDIAAVLKVPVAALLDGFKPTDAGFGQTPEDTEMRRAWSKATPEMRKRWAQEAEKDAAPSGAAEVSDVDQSPDSGPMDEQTR